MNTIRLYDHADSLIGEATVDNLPRVVVFDCRVFVRFDVSCGYEETDALILHRAAVREVKP